MQIYKRLFTENDSRRNGRRNLRGGVMIHSTATPGVMAEDWYCRWNRRGIGKSVHAFVDDKSVWQYMEWEERAAHCGGKANDTHISLEICEPKSWREDGEYFAAAYKNAVELCAFLCLKFGLAPEGDVLCHSEGYARGVASNHGDVMHWFPLFGKSMDSFRVEVRAAMGGEKMDNEPKEWGREAVDWAREKGLLRGDGRGDLCLSQPVTREQLCVILHRLCSLREVQ